MRTFIIFSLGILMIIPGCARKTTKTPPPADLITLYSTQSIRTDPGEMKFLFAELPNSYDSLCDIIKSVLIHPFDASDMGMDLENGSEDGNILTAEMLLNHIYYPSEKGLKVPRARGERVVVACYHHCMLFTSMLREKGIPARMRAGYSHYFEKEYGIRFGHVICEVWDNAQERWIYIDPDRNILDLDKREFDLASEAWYNLRKEKVKPQKYVSSLSEGIRGVISLMALDASLVTGEEKLYWDMALIGYEDISRYGNLSHSRFEMLDNLAKYLDAPDSNFEELKFLYQNEEDLRPTGMSYEAYYEMVRN
jgi:hypothetical protein